MLQCILFFSGTNCARLLLVNLANWTFVDEHNATIFGFAIIKIFSKINIKVILGTIFTTITKRKGFFSKIFEYTLDKNTINMLWVKWKLGDFTNNMNNVCKATSQHIKHNTTNDCLYGKFISSTLPSLMSSNWWCWTLRS